ncbi:MAG: restriction endonuclease, partial [Blastocatellia bacterium]
LSPLLQEIEAMSAKAFENLVADVFKDLGFFAEVTHHSKDGGIDLIGLGGRDRQQKPILIQCKRYVAGKRIGVEAINSILAPVGQNGDRAVLVITSSFTVPADIPRKKDIRHFTRCRWVLDRNDWNRFLYWVARTPEIGEDTARSVLEARNRYSDLVDKKFRGSLSIEEESERKDLEDLLDAAEAPFYEQFKERLIAVKSRLEK